MLHASKLGPTKYMSKWFSSKKEVYVGITITSNFYQVIIGQV